MPYLTVADGFHTVYYHLRETFHREEFGIKTDNLHFLPPVYLAVLAAATVGGRDNHAIIRAMPASSACFTASAAMCALSIHAYTAKNPDCRT